MCVKRSQSNDIIMDHFELLIQTFLTTKCLLSIFYVYSAILGIGKMSTNTIKEDYSP